MGSHPIPHPNWGYGEAQTDLCRLQPLLELVRGLLQRGLMDASIQLAQNGPLRPQEVTVRMQTGPSCPDYPFSTESGTIGINTRTQGVLAPGVDPIFGPSPVLLRERADSLYVSMLDLRFST
jgi:hypothetical protein